MVTIAGVAEAALYVTDMARAKQFYTIVLGLPVSADFGHAVFLQTGPASTLILFNVAGIQARDSVIPDHGAVGEGHVALTIADDQLDGWRARLIEAGVTLEHEQTWSSGARSLYFRDPDRNSLELIQASHYAHVWQRLQAAAE